MRGLDLSNEEHGTVAAYHRHYRAKTRPCEACAKAHADYKREWNRAHPERVKAIRKKHYDNYPERAIARARKRDAIKASAYSEPYTLAEVLEAYGSSCHACLEPVDLDAPRHPGDEGWEKSLHIDHLVPLIDGGDDTLDNVRPAHAVCNLRRHAVKYEQDAP